MNLCTFFFIFLYFYKNIKYIYKKYEYKLKYDTDIFIYDIILEKLYESI